MIIFSKNKFPSAHNMTTLATTPVVVFHEARLYDNTFHMYVKNNTNKTSLTIQPVKVNYGLQFMHAAHEVDQLRW